MVLSSVMQNRVILGEIELFKVKRFMYMVCLGIFDDSLDIPIVHILLQFWRTELGFIFLHS